MLANGEAVADNPVAVVVVDGVVEVLSEGVVVPVVGVESVYAYRKRRRGFVRRKNRRKV